MTSTGRKISNILFIITLLLFTAFLGRKLQQQRYNLPVKFFNPAPARINPRLVKIISGDFSGIISDYLLLEAAHLIGGMDNATEEDWQIAATLYRRALYLDPFFFSIPYYIEGTLAWVNGQTDAANDMLKISHVHRTWDWQPGFYLGFNLYHLLGKYNLAAKYLRESSLRPHVPPFIPFLAAKISQETGRTTVSIALLQTMLVKADKEGIHYDEIKKRLRAYLHLQQIEKALLRFKKDHGNFPEHLADLVTYNYLESIPPNPYGKTYWYTPQKNGHVFFFPDNEE